MHFGRQDTTQAGDGDAPLRQCDLNFLSSQPKQEVKKWKKIVQALAAWGKDEEGLFEQICGHVLTVMMPTKLPIELEHYMMARGNPLHLIRKDGGRPALGVMGEESCWDLQGRRSMRRHWKKTRQRVVIGSSELAVSECSEYPMQSTSGYILLLVKS